MIREVKYEHYLLMESDIIFSGSLRNFLKDINNVNCDYVHIAIDNMGELKAHWPIELINDNPFKKIYFAWSQLFYVSYQFLVDIENFKNKNDSIYYEFLLPSFAYNNGYSIRQFENFGYIFQVSWGPSKAYEFIYKFQKEDNTFYHPIKDLSIVHFLNDSQ